MPELKSIWIHKTEFRQIPGEDRFVSRGGAIVSLRNGRRKMLALAPDKDGYLKVSRPEIKAHTAVLLAWRGPKPLGMECRHLDGDPTNNHVSNLIWGTRKENGADKAKHGTEKGEKNPAAKMTPQLVLEMRFRYKTEPLSALIKRYPRFSKFAIWAAVSGYTWAHLPGAIPNNRTCYKGSK